MRAHPDPFGPVQELAELAEELAGAFRAWEDDPRPWPEERVSELARRAFRLQLRHNVPYRRYCDRLGVGAEDVATWRDLPPVPTAAFREIPLCVGDPKAAPLTFLTSGTTRGPERRGRHPVPVPALYRASALAAFRRHVLGSAGRARILSLVPPFRPARESSLSWMCQATVERFGDDRSAFAAGPGGVEWEAAGRAAEEAAADGVPLVVLATTLAADGWSRHLEAAGRRLALPPGSRLVDTGGAKGRPGLRRSRVLDALEARLGLPVEAAVNEFGMTELLSQRYSRPGAPDPDAPPLYAPPWLRTRALDPNTLRERPAGRPGVLCHLDLANAGSACAVLTEDLGRVRDNVVEWLGRTPGAPPRGCSLATAELLAAQEEGA